MRRWVKMPKQLSKNYKNNMIKTRKIDKTKEKNYEISFEIMLFLIKIVENKLFWIQSEYKV